MVAAGEPEGDGGTCRLPDEGDVGGVAAVAFDVVLQPFEGELHVGDASIVGGIVVVELGEPGQPQAVADAHHHKPFACQRSAVDVGGGAFFKASTVDEGKDGQPVNRNSARRHVYVQLTVLAPGGSVVEQTGDGAVGHDAWRGHVFRLTIGVADWYA